MNNQLHYSSFPSHKSKKNPFFLLANKWMKRRSLLQNSSKEIPRPNYIKMNTITVVNSLFKSTFNSIFSYRFVIPLISSILLVLPESAEAQFTREYSSYWGGSSSDDHFGAVLDVSGNAYYVGYTQSSNFPNTSGAYQTSLAGGIDQIVTKVASDGSVIWSTYLGGSGNEDGWGVTISPDFQNLYIVANSESNDYPGINVTSYQSSRAGGKDVVVAKMGTNGNLVWSTYLGGSSTDEGWRVNTDGFGNVYVSGYTASSNFPTVAAVQSSKGGSNDGFITKLSSSGSVLWSTYVGGSGNEEIHEVVADNAGFIYVVGSTNSTNLPTTNPHQASNAGGHDFFIQKRNATTGAIVWSTYLGGSSDEGTQEYPGIAIGLDGGVYITGSTASSNFPTMNAIDASYGGSTDAVAAKFDNDGNLVWSTFLGGSSFDEGTSIMVSNGLVYIAGSTSSSNYGAITSGTAYQSSFGGSSDMFLSVLREDGTLAYGTFYGGSGDDEAHDMYVYDTYLTFGGHTTSGFSTSNAAQSTYGGGTYDGQLVLFSADDLEVASSNPLSATTASGCATTDGTITVKLSGSARGTENYDISVDGGFSFPYTNLTRSGNDVVVSNIGSGTYTVVIRDALGLTDNAGTVKVDGCIIEVCTYEDADAFSVPASNGATTYTWTVPTGATIVSGQGTNSIVVDWTNAATGTGKQVCVTPSNATCTGTQTCLDITISDCVEICGNGVDDDNDGDVDCDDSDCVPTFTGVTPTSPTSCSSNNGSIVVSATGNGTNIQYSNDNGSTWQNSNTFSSLAAGSYNIKIRYQGGSCEVAYIANPVVLTAPAQPIISNVTGTDPTNCGVNDGTITVSASISGGASLQYSRDNGSTWQNSNVFSSVPGGTYQIMVRVQGQTSCQAGPVPITLNTPSTPTISSVSSVDPTNCGVNDGTITISASGTGTLEYSINNGGSWSTSNLFSGLSAGSYNIKVRFAGASACEATYGSNPVTLTAPSSPSVSGTPTKTDPTDCGVNDGTITVTATGGSSPYEYSNDNGTTWQSSNIFINLSGGTYQIRVRNASGTSCVSSATTVSLTTLSTPVITNVTSSDPNNCNAGNGSITVTASGASGSLEYSNDGGLTFQNSNVFNGLGAGSYNIVVRYRTTDNCEVVYASNPVVLSVPASPSIDNVVFTDPTNCGTNDGTITITASGRYWFIPI